MGKLFLKCLIEPTTRAEGEKPTVAGNTLSLGLAARKLLGALLGARDHHVSLNLKEEQHPL